MKTLIAGILLFVLACVVVALAGCAPTWYRARGTGKATADVNVLITVGLDGHPVRRRVVYADNPTDQDHILDCHAFRCRIPAGLATDVLLMPHDSGCDMHADVEYSPNTEAPGIPIPDVPIGVTIKNATPAR